MAGESERGGEGRAGEGGHLMFPCLPFHAQLC